MLIAVKEGTTVFRGGTIFEVEGMKPHKKADGSIEECLQIPDDGMGRPLLLETKDVFVCGDDDLRNAERGHGRCYFSKEEIIHPSKEVYKYDFSPRSINFEKAETGWQFTWRIPSNNLNKECLFVNKITKETTRVHAECRELEYEEISLSAIDYKQTVRKRKAVHHIWDLDPLAPGFYSGEIDLGDEFRGRVHFIKHFPVQLSNKDPRETTETIEIPFSPELWNAALKLKLAWGPKSRIPFQVRVLDSFPELVWGQANFLERMCTEILSFVWRVYEKEADGEISPSDTNDVIVKSYPWIDDERLSQLKALGEYYARMKR
jgi:hypothetical protein